MILLIIFAFLAGIVTVLSPCILPVLPIILSTSVGGHKSGRSHPTGVIVGFVLSFTFFTLFLSIIVKLSGIPAESLRYLSIFIIILFGLSLLVPKIQVLTEQLFTRLSRLLPSRKTVSNPGFVSGVLVGISLGLLWTPCVGPILASVISLAITGTVTLDALLITLAYSLGTAIPMFMIMLGGQNFIRRAPWLLSNTAKIQKVFGVVMILTAFAIFNNVDRQFQTYILNKFPNYGVGLTKLEDNRLIRTQLDKINSNSLQKEDLGKPMFDLLSPKGVIAPEINGGGEWFNSKPLTLKELQGKVVLVDFWTYTCINCQRTFPYLKNWWDKYKDKGLVIIGVHSPEFEFEKGKENIEKAILDFGLEYPIVQDNDFATWRAYNNRYWPAKYFIDKEGHIRYTHFGEGEYDESERVIQELLKETGAKDVPADVDNPSYKVETRTPELYLGFERIENIASPEEIVPNVATRYSTPKIIPSNYFSYDGVWTIMDEYASPKKGATLRLNFEAKEVYLVMRTNGKPAKVKVYVDDKMQYFGTDVKDGILNVDEDRLYKLVKLPVAGRHILKLEFMDDNTQLFAFTSG